MGLAVSLQAGRTMTTPADSVLLGENSDWLISSLPAVPGACRSLLATEHRLFVVKHGVVGVRGETPIGGRTSPE
jgi:hypothetical protein